MGKPLEQVRVALIPNAKDYYAERARGFTLSDLVRYMEELGLKVEIVDLRDYDNPEALKEKLASYDLIWAMGGNTYMLRYEMHRSGFEKIIKELLEAGVESADEPEFAEELIKDVSNLFRLPFFLTLIMLSLQRYCLFFMVSTKVRMRLSN